MISLKDVAGDVKLKLCEPRSFFVFLPSKSVYYKEDWILMCFQTSDSGSISPLSSASLVLSHLTSEHQFSVW